MDEPENDKIACRRLFGYKAGEGEVRAICLLMQDQTILEEQVSGIRPGIPLVLRSGIGAATSDSLPAYPSAIGM